MGRLEHALDSLRLLCTRDPLKAKELAHILTETNRTRQDLTESALTHALALVASTGTPSFIAVADPSYDEGVIGLVAAKITQMYHRPSLVISVGPEFSKGSARSVTGFHITDHLRSFSHLLESVGGHAMAAGFTIKTARLDEFIFSVSSPDIPPELLVKKQRIDCEIPLTAIDYKLMAKLEDFEPFGLGNPTPVFLSKNVPISTIRHIGQHQNHLKFKAGPFDAIWFNASPPSLESKDKLGVNCDLIYSVDKNTFNSRTDLQLKIVGIES
jgi:single-stranded-DNA-specific exonuclease